MKKISKLLFIFTALATLAVACKEEEQYEWGPEDVAGCYGVYFPTQEASGSHTYDPTKEPTAEFTVKRTNATGAITVPVKYTESESGIFQVGTLSFADGETETTLKVDFPNSGLGTEYSLSLQIDDPQYASYYNDNAIALDFSVLRVEWKYFLNPKTGEKAVFSITEDWNELEHTCYVKYYEVDGIRTCVTEDSVSPEGYKGFFGTGADKEVKFTWYTGNKNADGKQMVELPVTDVYYHSTYSAMVQAFDYYSYWTVINPQASLSGMSWLDFAKKYNENYPLGYYDGNGGFHFYITYYYMMGVGGWKVMDYSISLLADGFTRVDYSIEAETDYSVDGVLPLVVALGTDVAKVKYAAYEGELTATQIAKKVENISAGIDATEEIIPTEEDYYEDYAKYLIEEDITLPATGTYTIVLASCDENGGVQETTSVVAPYVAAGDTEANAVKIKVGTEATSSRWAEYGYKATNSFAYYVDGQDLTDVHVAAYKTSYYEANEEECNYEIKYEEDPADEDFLAEVNAAGGYSDLFIKLDANTSYTVVVWATNGILDTIVTSEWTTDGLPNEVVKEGTAYAYTKVLNQLLYGTKSVAYAEGLNLEYNPNTKGYEIPSWGNGVTFKFTEKDGKIDVPIQSTGVSTSNYGTFYVMSAKYCDDFFGEGAADYFKYDVTKESSIDANGDYQYYLMYASTAGYAFGVGYETLYVNGKPSDSSVIPTAPSMKPVMSPIKVSAAYASEEIATAGLKIEREPEAVAVKAVKAAPAARQASEKKMNQPIVKF